LRRKSGAGDDEEGEVREGKSEGEGEREGEEEKRREFADERRLTEDAKAGDGDAVLGPPRRAEGMEGREGIGATIPVGGEEAAVGEDGVGVGP
jgi:hypothetical protein